MNTITDLSGGAKIVAGLAVFAVCWFIQATMGDSSMFSMSYMDSGFVQGLLVNLTFWPGWLMTAGLIGSGVMQMLDDNDTDGSDPRTSEEVD